MNLAEKDILEYARATAEFSHPVVQIKSELSSCGCVIEHKSPSVICRRRQQGAVVCMTLSKHSCERESEDFLKLSDEELARYANAGHHDAITVLFDRYNLLVYDVAVRIVRDPGEAEDVVQNVFLDIFRAMANFDSRKGILKVWILQYAYHRALHRKRHLVSNHFYRWENLEAAAELGSRRPLWGELPETLRLAEQMLENLKPHQREVVEMTYYEGLTAEEIAQRRGDSPHAVRHHLQRGVAALRKIFGSSNGKG